MSQQFKGLTGGLNHGRITPDAYRKTDKPEDHEHEKNRVVRDRLDKLTNPANGGGNNSCYLSENVRDSHGSRL